MMKQRKGCITRVEKSFNNRIANFRPIRWIRYTYDYYYAPRPRTRVLRLTIQKRSIYYTFVCRIRNLPALFPPRSLPLPWSLINTRDRRRGDEPQRNFNLVATIETIFPKRMYSPCIITVYTESKCWTNCSTMLSTKSEDREREEKERRGRFP